MSEPEGRSRPATVLGLLGLAAFCFCWAYWIAVPAGDVAPSEPSVVPMTAPGEPVQVEVP